MCNDDTIIGQLLEVHPRRERRMRFEASGDFRWGLRIKEREEREAEEGETIDFAEHPHKQD